MAEPLSVVPRPNRRDDATHCRTPKAHHVGDPNAGQPLPRPPRLGNVALIQKGAGHLMLLWMWKAHEARGLRQGYDMQIGIAQRAAAALRRLEDALLVAILAAMILVAAWQVIARNFFDTGLLWGDALVRVLVLWVAMLGAMVASRKDDHIRIDLVSRFVGEAWRRRLQRFACAFAGAVLAVFAWHSFRFVHFEYQDGVIAFAAVPAWVCESILPLGAGLMSLRYMLHALDPP